MGDGLKQSAKILQHCMTAAVVQTDRLQPTQAEHIMFVLLDLQGLTVKVSELQRSDLTHKCCIACSENSTHL